MAVALERANAWIGNGLQHGKRLAYGDLKRISWSRPILIISTDIL
jgi:hypothetical protein